MRIKPFILLAVALVSRHGSIRGEDITFKQINYVETVIDKNDQVGFRYDLKREGGTDFYPYQLKLTDTITTSVAEDNTFGYNNNRYYRLKNPMILENTISAIKFSNPEKIPNSLTTNTYGKIGYIMGQDVEKTEKELEKISGKFVTKNPICPTITQSDLDNVKKLIETEKKGTKIFYVEIVFDRFNNLAIKFSPKKSTLSDGGKLGWKSLELDEKLKESDETIEANGFSYEIRSLDKEKNVAFAYQFSDSPTIDTLANSHITESAIYIIPTDLKNSVMIESKNFIIPKTMEALFDQDFFNKLKETLDQREEKGGAFYLLKYGYLSDDGSNIFFQGTTEFDISADSSYNWFTAPHCKRVKKIKTIQHMSNLFGIHLLSFQADDQEKIIYGIAQYDLTSELLGAGKSDPSNIYFSEKKVQNIWENIIKQAIEKTGPKTTAEPEFTPEKIVEETPVSENKNSEPEEEVVVTEPWVFNASKPLLSYLGDFYVKLEHDPNQELALSVTKIDEEPKEGIYDDYWLIVKLENLKNITTADPTITINGIKYAIAEQVIKAMKEYNEKKGDFYNAIKKFREEEEENYPWGFGLTTDVYLVPDLQNKNPLDPDLIQIFIELENEEPGGTPLRYDLHMKKTVEEGIDEYGHLWMNINKLKGKDLDEDAHISLNNKKFVIQKSVVNEINDQDSKLNKTIKEKLETPINEDSKPKWGEGLLPIIFLTRGQNNSIQAIVKKNTSSFPPANDFLTLDQFVAIYMFDKYENDALFLEACAKMIFSTPIFYKYTKEIIGITLPETPLNSQYQWADLDTVTKPDGWESSDIPSAEEIQKLIDELYADQHLTEFAGALNMTLRS